MANSFGWKALVINVIALLTGDLVSVCGQLHKELILHYDFEQTNGNRQVIDRSGNGRNATIDTDIKNVQGQCGEGIALPKESLRINTGPPSTPENKTIFVITIAAWIFMNETQGQRTIFKSYHSNETGGEKRPFLYFGIKNDNKLRFSATSKNAKKNTFKPADSDNSTLKPGVWQHVAVSYKFSNGGESCLFFVNARDFMSKHPGNTIKPKMSVDYPPLGHTASIGDKKGDAPFIMDNFYIFQTALFLLDIQLLMDELNDTCKAIPTTSTTEPATSSATNQPTSTTKEMTSSTTNQPTTKEMTPSTNQPTSATKEMTSSTTNQPTSTTKEMTSSTTNQPTSTTKEMTSSTNQPKSATKEMNSVERDLDRARKITSKTEAKNFIKDVINDRIALRNISGVGEDVGREAMGNTRLLEEVGLILANNTLKANESVSVEATSAFFLMKRPYAGFTFPHADEQNTKKIRESMLFPDDMVKAENGVGRAFACMSYTNIHESMPPVIRISSRLFNPNTTLTLNSKIIGTAVSPPLEKPLTNPIKVIFTHAKISSGKQVCSFWNHSLRTTDGKYGSWSTSGCKLDVEHSTSTKTVCLCDHLTNFALLLQREGAPYSEPPLSLKIITIIGCSLSILACLLCFIMFFTLKKKDIRHYLHINLTFAIAVAQLILLFGITQTEYKILCKVMAACLHYFYLVAFLLMLCEGVHLAILIESAFSHGDLKLPTYLITSWGLPLVIVGITLGARFDNYGSSNACFISADQGTVYAFVGPFALILVINFVILVIVLRHVVRKTSLPISAKTASNFEIARATIRSLVILFPVMGFTWVFGILYFGFRSLALEYLFAIFCSLQGFFIFLLQYALNTENRAAFARATRRWRLTLTSSLNSSANPTKKTGAPSVKISPPDSKENSQEMHTSTVDNCHLMLYRNVDNNGSGTLDSRTTSTFI